MANEPQKLSDILNPPEKSMGAIEAVKEGVGLGIGEFLSQMKEVGGAIWDATADKANQGKTELAAALYSPHGSGFVMYGEHDKQQDQQAPDHGLEAVKQPEVQDRGMER